MLYGLHAGGPGCARSPNPGVCAPQIPVCASPKFLYVRSPDPCPALPRPPRVLVPPIRVCVRVPEPMCGFSAQHRCVSRNCPALLSPTVRVSGVSVPAFPSAAWATLHLDYCDALDAVVEISPGIFIVVLS